MRLFLLISLMLLCCCSDTILYNTDDTVDTNFLTLYMDTTQDPNGYYLIDYPNSESNSYTVIYYESLPWTRVHWSSVDSFTVYHMGFPVTAPIVNFSTYTRADSTGQTFIYLQQNFLDDTLSITGYINEQINSTINFIVY